MQKHFIVRACPTRGTISNTIPALKTVDTSLDTLRSQRTAAQQKVTEARRALADAVDGCVYHEYIYSALQLG